MDDSNSNSLPDLLRKYILQCLAGYLHENAIFLSEEYFNLFPSQDTLRLLTHCYVSDNQLETAWRLLDHYFPFTFDHDNSVTTLHEQNSVSDIENEDFNGRIATVKNFLSQVSVPNNNSDFSLVFPSCVYSYGVLSAKTGRYSIAIRLFHELINKNEDNISFVHYWLGYCEERNGNNDNAINNFSNALDRSPHLFIAFEKKCQLAPSAVSNPYQNSDEGYLSDNGDEDQTVSQRVMPSLLNSGNVLFHFLYPYAEVARNLYSLHCVETVIICKRCVPIMLKNSLCILKYTSMAYFHQGNPQKAVKYFIQFQTRAPWKLDDEVSLYYSSALWQLNSCDMLGKLCRKMIDFAPRSAITLGVIGNFYSHLGEPHQSLKMFDRAISVAPSLAYLYSLRGYESMVIERETAAKEAFQKALSLDGKSYLAYSGLGELFFRSGDYSNAVLYFHRALKFNKLPSILNRLAMSYCGSTYSPEEKYEIASELCKESLRIQPFQLETQILYGDILMEYNQINEAIEIFSSLHKKYPKESSILISLGRCYSIQATNSSSQERGSEKENLETPSINDETLSPNQLDKVEKAMCAFYKAIHLDSSRIPFIKVLINELTKHIDIKLLFQTNHEADYIYSNSSFLT